MSARDQILERIRNANAASGGPETERRVIYPCDPSQRPDERTELLLTRLRDYKAQAKAISREDVADEIAAALERRGILRAQAAPGFPEKYLSSRLACQSEILSTSVLTQLEGVVTLCALAIAQTGTIVLDSGAGQGNRAFTLVPDYHLCIVPEVLIVDGVAEALLRLESTAREGNPLTFISGPSATSDIELQRVEGVHGPRTLEVLVVEGEGE